MNQSDRDLALSAHRTKLYPGGDHGPDTGPSPVIGFIALGAVTLMPFLVSPSGRDPFRLPKEIWLVATGITLSGVWLAGMLLGVLRPPSFRARPIEIGLPLLIAFWFAVTTLTSVNIELSIASTIEVIGAAVLFVALTQSLRDKPIGFVWFLGIPGLVNAVLVIIQASGVWNPFFRPPQSNEAFSFTALIGNTNDVGSFLLPFSLAMLSLTMIKSGAQRLAAGLAMLILASGIVATQSRSAIGAFAVASLVAVAISSWKRAVVGAAALAGGAVVAMSIYPALFDRLDAFRLGSWQAFFTGRLVSFASAWLMFRHHPFLGVGPGCFQWLYFDYKALAEHIYPQIALAGPHQNFGQAHNDHLQIAAETGVVGYALFLAALAVLSSASFARRTSDDRSRFSRLTSLPTATGLFVLALAQFPLQVPASAVSFLLVTALCLAWGRDGAH